MKKIFYLLMLLFAQNIYGQENKPKQYEINTAVVKDKKFFHQLDSIITNVYKLKYKYYIVYVWNKEGDNLYYTPTKSDSILYLTLNGSETPLVYGFHNKYFFETIAHRRCYFVGKGVEGLLIKKYNKKTYELSNEIIRKNMSRDMHSPILRLEYKNRKLTVTADSRVDRYLVE